jgi:hypothetical protein
MIPAAPANDPTNVLLFMILSLLLSLGFISSFLFPALAGGNTGERDSPRFHFPRRSIPFMTEKASGSPGS